MQYPTSAVLSPTSSPAVVTEGTSLVAGYKSSGSIFVAVPVAVVLVVLVVLGAFRAHAWRRKRTQAGDRGSGRDGSSSATRTAAHGRNSTAVLIEENSEDYADVWNNIDFSFGGGEQSTNPNLSPQAEHEGGSDSSSSSTSDSPILCTVEAEIHTDPAVHRPTPSCSRDTELPDSVNASYTDLNILSQLQDFPSSSTATIVSPSANTSNDTSSTVTNSAQEIVDMIQSEGLMLDSSVLQSGSSEFSLFTGCEGRKRVQEPSEEEQLIIPLSEIDSPETLWEDWEQELSTIV